MKAKAFLVSFLLTGVLDWAAVDVIPDVILEYDNESNAFHILTEPSDPTFDGRLKGRAVLKSGFAKHIKSLAGFLPFGQEDTIVHTTLLSTSTHRHTDAYGTMKQTTSGDTTSGGDADEKPKIPVSGRVGFVALKSSDDAYFEHHGAFGTCVPIKEGSFIQFDGRVPHNTIIKNGSVKMLGPFEVATFAAVEHNTIPVCRNHRDCNKNQGKKQIAICAVTLQRMRRTPLFATEEKREV